MAGGRQASRRRARPLGQRHRDRGRPSRFAPAEAFPTASSIKVAVLYELFRQADEGKIDLAEVTRPPLPRVRGGGVLQELGDQVSLTWRDLAVLMIGWSDNEAANRLIDKVGMDAVDRRMTALALPGVRLRRKMMDLEAARRGDENVAHPGRAASADGGGPGRARACARPARPTCAVVAGTAESTRLSAPPCPKGRRRSPSRERSRACAARSPSSTSPAGPTRRRIMTKYLRRDADGAAAIREISALLFDTFDRLARSSEYGRIISER